jgi:uncharacterized protein YlxW (UPF0749 family)
LKQPRALTAVTLVAFVLGILLVMQLRAQDSVGGMEQLSAADLTVLIANLNDRNNLLRAEVADLEADLRAIEASGASGQGNVGRLQADLTRLRLWAGLDAIEGRGVVVAIVGPITADAVNDLLDELRLAGAEAIAVAGVRVVPGATVAGTPAALSIEGVDLGRAFEVHAIGSPQALQAILDRSGGIVSRIAVGQPDVSLEVVPSETALRLPATERDLTPDGATPRL